MMNIVVRRGRALSSSASVGLLAVLTGIGAWLGLWQAPTGPLPAASSWPLVLGTTEASSPLRFTMVVRSAGLSVQPSMSRTVGVVDFPHDEARALTVSQSPGLPDQWVESLVVRGRSYARFGSDIAGQPHFQGPWLRTSGLSIPPFPTLAGSESPSTAPGATDLVAESQVAGLTKYVGAVAISCGTGSGTPTTETVRSEAWVDGGGRLVRFKTTIERSERPDAPGVLDTVAVNLRSFGTRIGINAPANVIGPGLPAEPGTPNPLAGCLVTPA
jgi:hypothetical protein